MPHEARRVLSRLRDLWKINRLRWPHIQAPGEGCRTPSTGSSSMGCRCCPVIGLCVQVLCPMRVAQCKHGCGASLSVSTHCAVCVCELGTLSGFGEAGSRDLLLPQIRPWKSAHIPSHSTLFSQHSSSWHGAARAATKSILA